MGALQSYVGELDHFVSFLSVVQLLIVKVPPNRSTDLSFLEIHLKRCCLGWEKRVCYVLVIMSDFLIGCIWYWGSFPFKWMVLTCNTIHSLCVIIYNSFKSWKTLLATESRKTIDNKKIYSETQLQFWRMQCHIATSKLQMITEKSLNIHTLIGMWLKNKLRNWKRSCCMSKKYRNLLIM